MVVSKAVRFAVVGLIALALSPVATALAGSTTSDASGFGVDPCYAQCRVLLTSVTPKREARRVFGNCMALCNHKGTLVCANGVTATVGKSSCH